MASYVQLTLEQRYLLQTLLQQKMTQKDIAQQLQVCSSTISRELRRNQASLEQPYLATSAHQQTQKRRQRSPYKLRGELALQVKKHLEKRWSPEQISGVLALANNGQRCISHEAIYQHIYRQKPGSESLIGYLRIRHKKRYKKRGSPQKRGSIPGRVGIEHRPAIVDTNTEVGHWEGDTVIGFDHDGVLVTLVERVFKYTCIVKVPSKKADIVGPAIEKALANCGLPVKSLTLDNGREFTDHAAITATLKIPVYFARPYHSWERGLNENTNGLIRQYIPKCQRISIVSEEFVSSIANDLNHRPRKTLGYLSPSQCAEKHRIALQT